MGMFLKDINLKGKTALITGATKGLGRGAAIAIAEAGGNIIAIGRNQIELKTYKKNKKKESEKLEILKNLKNQDYNNVFVLDKSGKNFSSLEFADVLNNKINSGCKKLNFIIGSEEGLDSFFKDSFLTISFGNQTWPHLLVRVMLIEQIYRGLEIIKNSRYHK